MSIFDSGYDNLRDHAKRYGVSSIPGETGWSDNHDVTADFMKQEMISTSENTMIGPQVSKAVKLFRELNPDKTADGKLKKIDLGIYGERGNAGLFVYNKQFLEDNHQKILNLQVQYPEAGYKTIDDIMKDAQDRARVTREKMSQVSANSSGLGKLGLLTGGIEGFAHDPILVASMVFGTGKITGPSKGINAWRAFKTEAAIASGAEMLITPSVMSWKDKIHSPYSLKDATINILTVGAFAGVTRAGGSYVVDVFEARKAVASLRAAGKNGEADVVESYVNLQEKGVGNQDAHIQAYAKAQEALDSGKIVEQAELDKITGGKIGLESVDPKGVKVDAATFQFKARGDDLGVTDRLDGVKNWDPIKAGTSIIWERADGARFIADGHQRLALAKRLIGDDAQDIGLNAFIMREADGYSAETVRDIAAFKNIAEGSGSALDAAKVIRSGNNLGDDLPPNSALVRDARGLSKLDDESFRLVIDEKIDAKYGAIVGELISKADEQSAVIRALSKSKPANANQARIMVSDMKAAGFTKTETHDLFGGMEITESLFKERAKVIDSAMRQIKKDKSVFKTLAEQESRIAGAGNKLDRDANLLRLSDDEKTLATLTSLANAKGGVSDAINDAARRVKDGESIQQATRDILPELKRAGESQLNDGATVHRAGDEQPTLTVREQIDALPKGVKSLAVEPKDAPGLSIGILEKDGKRHAIVEIDRSKIDIDCDNFCYPDLKHTLKDGHVLLKDTQKKYKLKNGKYKPARAKKHKKYIDSKLAEGVTAAKGEKPIVWLMGGGGASGKGTVLKKLQKDGVISKKGFVHIDPDDVKLNIDEYKEISKKGDYRAASVVHGESSDVAKALQVAATDKKLNMIIDKTLGKQEKALKLIQDLKDSGYDVRMVGVTIDPSEALVRALTRYYGSGRLVPPKMIIKAHKGFNAAFPAYAKKVDSALLFDNTIKAEKIAAASKGKITIVSKEAYNISQARGKLNEATTTHKQLRESQGLPGRLDGQSDKIARSDTGRVAGSDQGSNLRGAGEGAQSSQAKIDLVLAEKDGFVFGKDTTLNTNLVTRNGKVIADGDFDQGSDSWWLSNEAEKGQTSFHTADEVIEHYKETPVADRVLADSNGVVFGKDLEKDINVVIKDGRVIATGWYESTPDAWFITKKGETEELVFRGEAGEVARHFDDTTTIDRIDAESDGFVFGKDLKKDISVLTKDGKVISTGDFDFYADGWWMDVNGSQRSFSKPDDIIDFFRKNETSPGPDAPTKQPKLNDQLKDSGLDLDDPYLNELHANELKQVDDLLAKHGDMEIPTGIRLVDGEEVIEFRTAREVMQELDDESKVVDDMFKCMGE